MVRKVKVFDKNITAEFQPFYICMLHAIQLQSQVS